MATLRGTPGNDNLLGGDEDDRIFGLAGNDRLVGGRGDDRISGGVGNDRMAGQAGADVLLGGRGDDRIDGGAGDDQIFGGSGNDRLVGGRGIDVLTGGAGADQFVFRSAADAVDRITDFDPDQGDALTLTGALTGAAVQMVDDGTNTTVQVRTADADGFTDLVVLENHREPIDVWYGDQQQFGDPGEAQRWVNILGNVATTGLTSFTYALNGGPEQALSVGPNRNRLEDTGDFNVELDYDQLDPSAGDDLVTIRATYGNGEVFTRQVTVDYEDGQAWPTNYSIDWEDVTNLQDVVQVVDGHWAFDDNGVRTAAIGYDRVLALGDVTWDSYEVRLTFTPHDLSNVATGGAIWFGMQWGGHTDNPFGGSPHYGYIPGATFMLNGAAILRPSDFEGDPDNPRVVRGAPILEEHTYNVLIQNVRVASDVDLSDGLDRTYSIKIWEVGSEEPVSWLIQQTMTDQEPLGSFYLNGHFVDVTFGDIAFTELPANDLLASQDHLPALLEAGAGPAAPVAATAPAAGEGGASGSIGSPPALSDLVLSDTAAAA